MITILHGDDVVSSRKYLVELKSSVVNPLTLDGKNLELNDLIQTLKSNSLFSDEKNIFIENLFSKKKSKDLEEIIELIKKNSNQNLVIWDSGELSKPQLSTFPKAKINLFKISKTLFNFLDSISPNNSKNVLRFHEALKTSDEEMLFYMLIRQFRLLLALSSGANSIDDVQRLSPWQKDKLVRQSKLFTVEELKIVYNKLYEADLNIKTGVQSNLTAAIDFLLIDL